MSGLFEKISGIFTESLKIDDLPASCKASINSCINRNPWIENRVKYWWKNPNSLSPQTIAECFIAQEKLEIFLSKNPEYKKIASRFWSSSIWIYNEVMAAYSSWRSIEDLLNSSIPPSAITRWIWPKTRLSVNENREKSNQIAEIDSQIDETYFS